MERREGGHYKNQKGVIKGLDDSAIIPCVLVCVAGSMRCNNHPSDGSVLGCGDFDLMLEKTEIQNRIVRRSFEICKKFKLHGTALYTSTLIS